MAKVDYVKINNTIHYIQNVAYLSELPVANENSADFVSVNNELYVKQVNGTTYTYEKVGGSGGGSAEPIIKTPEITGTGSTITFTEDELAQIQNNLGTVVKVEIGGEYLPLSPAYSRVSAETMQPQLILCCELVEYNSWYKFYPTEDPLVFKNSQDTSSPFGGGSTDPTVIDLNDYVPATAKNGTLDSSVLATLQASDSNYIVFNNEIFKLADKQHNEGYLVYSHNGHDTTGCFFQKCITITLSTRGWVLEEQENASKTYVSEQITSAYGFDVSVNGQTLVFNTIGDVLQGDY